MVRVLATVAMLGLWACGSPPPPRIQAAVPALEPARYRVTISGRVASYDGPLEAAGVAELRRSRLRLTTLRIRSTGGDVDVGMDLAEWVLDHRLDVVVNDYCLSSCANYVFPAGRRKIIAPGGVVAWHGSARQANMAEQLEAALADAKARDPSLDVNELRATMAAYMKRVIARQDAFYARIAVAECVTRIGQIRLGAPGLFTMSIADMRRFGIVADAGPASASDIAPRILKRTGVTFVAVGELDPHTACQ